MESGENAQSRMDHIGSHWTDTHAGQPDDYLKNHAILPANNPRRITTDELMKDLCISPSSSGSTICQDEYLSETTPPTTPTTGSVYGIFKWYKKTLKYWQFYYLLLLMTFIFVNN